MSSKEQISDEMMQAAVKAYRDKTLPVYPIVPANHFEAIHDAVQAAIATAAALEGEAVPVAWQSKLGPAGVWADDPMAFDPVFRAKSEAAGAIFRPLYASPSSNADRLEGVKVKAIHWNPTITSDQVRGGATAKGLSPLGEYLAFGDGAWADLDSFYHVVQGGSLDTAKAAAQADFDQRVRSCLTSPDTHQDDKRVGETRNDALREAAKVARDHAVAWGLAMGQQAIVIEAAILALVKPQGGGE